MKAPLGRAALRQTVQMTWDTGAWIVAVLMAWSLRFDFAPRLSQWPGIVLLAVMLAALQLLLGTAAALYRGRYRTGSLDEVTALTVVALTVGTAGTFATVIGSWPGVPRSLPLLAACLALVLEMTARAAVRIGRLRAYGGVAAQRVVIYGAGHTGEHLTRLMLSDPEHAFRPVAMLDDDPTKQGLRTYGVRVRGGIAELERIVSDSGAESLVVAITRITAAQLRDLDRRCKTMKIELRVVPAATDLLTQGIKLGDLSRVTIEDLLGRQPIYIDISEVQSLLRGKRVLITGAGGSIGSELARQVHRYGPSHLFLLDRDESALQSVELSLDGRGLLASDCLVLADIRDAQRVREVVCAVKPDIVFHAAALKHLSLLEAYPNEAFKTNVIGTANVIKAALEVRVEAFVNISTDKAADPTSVLGMSKRITERMCAGIDASAHGRYLSVRFGNVLGSRGSVLNTFRAQIEAGGPVTITHPDVTRFFMTVHEAVQLVLQASTVGAHGSTLILDMGGPVRIADVAEQLIAMCGNAVPLEYVGLRPGEKLHEVLIGSGESKSATVHPMISSVAVEPLSLKTVEQNAEQVRPRLASLQELCWLRESS